MAVPDIKTVDGLRGASLGWRLLSLIVDLMLTGFVVGLLHKTLAKEAALPIGMILLWLYFAGLESSPLKGTLGKLLMGLSVVDLNGHQISLGQATGRHFSRKFAFCVFAGLGTLAVILSPRKQALHDWSSMTLVVRDSDVPAITKQTNLAVE